ncbi:MAG: hypothetical protein Q9195_008076 [Heterodermia aff. obscurata]
MTFDSTLAPPTTSSILTAHHILYRVPLVVLWVWINLLPFTISNQRQPDAIKEDALNKPWRPIPAGRLTPGSAKRIMVFQYFIAVIASYLLGSLPQCLSLILLGYFYNDLNGGDLDCVLRNFINACGYTCFSSGAMQVVIGPFGGSSSSSTSTLLRPWAWWFALLACIVFSTVQAQDMYDQRGDAARNRKTLPLVLGDGPARWMIAIPTVVYSWLTPFLWKTSLLGYAFPVSLGTVIATRTLMIRTEEADRGTFRVWNLWMGCVYSLPMIQALGV